MNSFELSREVRQYELDETDRSVRTGDHATLAVSKIEDLLFYEIWARGPKGATATAAEEFPGRVQPPSHHAQGFNIPQKNTLSRNRWCLTFEQS